MKDYLEMVGSGWGCGQTGIVFGEAEAESIESTLRTEATRKTLTF